MPSAARKQMIMTAVDFDAFCGCVFCANCTDTATSADAALGLALAIYYTELLFTVK